MTEPCEFCGGAVGQYPHGCPGCSAPQCCQRCCNGGSPSLIEQFRRMRADLDRTAAEVERLRNQIRAWEQKAATWMASPEAAQRLEGYRELAQKLNAAEAAKDGAYLERNQCVALIARMAHALGYWAGTAKTAIEGWSEDWHGCVYIDLPAGQVSWHYHDTQSYLFDWLPPYCADWDGHDTPEKYRRVLDRSTMPNARAERTEAELRAALKGEP